MRSELAALPENYQQCRENRHPWTDYTVIEERRTLEQVQICPRCANQRSRILSTRKQSLGHIVKKWQIKYVQKGYLLKLSDTDVAKVIKAKAAGEKVTDIAEEFGISGAYVYSLANGRNRQAE